MRIEVREGSGDERRMDSLKHKNSATGETHKLLGTLPILLHVSINVAHRRMSENTK